MENVSQAILQQVGIKAGNFSPSSRYNNVPVTNMNGNNGEAIAYLKRRFVPRVENFFVLQMHTVKEDDRLDNLAYQYYGDPERFWQICDANNAMDPGEVLDIPGSRVNITLPEGIPGNSHV